MNPKAEALFRRLAALGYAEAQVRAEGLPEWWDDVLWDNPSSFAEGRGHIARGLKMPFADLLSEEEKSKPRRVFGSGKGEGFWMADDFNEPLEDFKDYM